jgi:phosphoribosyl-ATP pyrophosphohydrolase
MNENNTSNPTRPLEMLDQTIAQRNIDFRGIHARQTLQQSYTAKLLAGGTERIGDKVIEEAVEVTQAAGQPGVAGREHTIREAADLVYHLLVLLAARDIRLADIEAELARRQGISGLVEKAARTEQSN